MDIKNKYSNLHIVVFAHPDFIGSRSMNRYADHLVTGLKALGHTTELWKPKAILNRLPGTAFTKKWMGYLDSFFLFPLYVRLNRSRIGRKKEAIFVFSDQALGPWVPIVKKYKHVVHCHDFLALQSSLGNHPQNPTSASGKMYQRYIWKGFSQALNFISVSNKTKIDLRSFLQLEPDLSVVVYNGLNPHFKALDKFASRNILTKKNEVYLDKGYIMHIGATVWYKNKIGVVQIYVEWRKISDLQLPLILIGDQPDPETLRYIQNSEFKNDICIIYGKNDDEINQWYSGSDLLLFPSLAEGFGWPIVEAMACGTVVLTSDAAPMKEVGSDTAFYIPVKPFEPELSNEWAIQSALIVEKILHLNATEKEERIKKGIEYSRNFELSKSIKQIETVYLNIVNKK